MSYLREKKYQKNLNWLWRYLYITDVGRMRPLTQFRPTTEITNIFPIFVFIRLFGPTLGSFNTIIGYILQLKRVLKKIAIFHPSKMAFFS